ncbi:MAG: HEAT repeat domain-containing protein [Nanoarchaeota archaeon]|nr:HEAT repeat domain-containing protein [Nanoarchaeota archaeon]
MPNQEQGPMIESSLLYTRENGNQGFVHDSYGDFFLARALADKVDSGELIPDEVHHMLKNKLKVVGVINAPLSGTVLSTPETANANLDLESHKGPLDFKNVIGSSVGISIIKDPIVNVLPYLIGLSSQEAVFIDNLLQDNPPTGLLADCYTESSHESSLIDKVMGYLITHMKEVAEDYGKLQEDTDAFKRIKPDVKYVCDLFESGQRRLREVGAEILATYDWVVAEPLLGRYIKHENWHVRWNGAVCLGHYDTYESRQYLYGILVNDPIEHLTCKVAMILSESQNSPNAQNYSMEYYYQRLAKNDFDRKLSEKARMEIDS